MKHLFFPLLLLLIWACDPTDPVDDEPEVAHFTCNVGFLTNTANESCYCPDDHVALGTMECRLLESGEYYAAMEGCFVDLGMIVKFDDDSYRSFSDTLAAVDIDIENPDTTLRYGDFPIVKWSPTFARIHTVPGRPDSVSWEISPQEYKKPIRITSTPISPGSKAILYTKTPSEVSCVGVREGNDIIR
jgi:hypothetical protein